MPTVVSSSNRPPISTRGQLVEDVCAYKGFDTSDNDLVNRVLRFLDKSVGDLNATCWDSSRVVESGITFTEGQQWVILTNQCFKISQVYLVHNTDGDQPPMSGLPWVHFKRKYPSSNNSSKPCLYSLFNIEKDERIYFDCLIDADTVNNYTLAVEYYKRLPAISGVGQNNNPDIPDYFENTILYGAFKRLCAHLGDTAGMSANAALEREALERLKRIDNSYPDADRRMRLIDEIAYPGSITNDLNPFF